MSDKIVVKNGLADLIAFTRLVPKRRNKIRSAAATSLPVDPVARTVEMLHPERMYLKIKEVVQETDSTKSYTLVPDPDRGTRTLALFRAGQYLNLRIEIGGSVVSRNYSLSSTPADAEAGFYRVTVRKKETGFVTPFVFEEWKEGVALVSSGPVGDFVYEPLRDKAKVVALAGGCGITPILSIAKDLVERKANCQIAVIYGVRNSADIIFRRELEELAEKNPGKVAVHYVASEPDPGWKGKTGFITAQLIQEITGDAEEKSFFLCGPQAMYVFLDKELEKLSLKRRQVRRELFGEIDDPSRIPGFPKSDVAKSHTITVHMADETLRIGASGSETVLVALERAGLAPPSRCRSGECGWCRSKLLAGDVFVIPDNDGRRMADRKFNWIHPCSSYPLSDLEMRVPRSTY